MTSILSTKSNWQKLVFFVISFFMIVTCVACKPKLTAQDYINSGLKSLEESKYEDAITAFTNALELEPDNIDAYRGRAESYGNSNQYELAKTDYESLFNLVSDNIEDYTKAIALCIKNKDIDTANSFTKQKEAQFGEDSLTEADKQVPILSSFFDELVKTCESQGFNNINEEKATEIGRLLEDDIYNAITVFVEDYEMPLIFKKNEKYCGVYDIPTPLPQDYMIYYGDMSDDIRNGDGYWLNNNSRGKYVVLSQWENDAPNGSFEEYSLYDVSTSCDAGTVKNGLYDGCIESHTTSVDSDSPRTTEFISKFANGIPEIIEKTLSGNGYIIAFENYDNSITLTMPAEEINLKHGLKGFFEYPVRD